MADGWRCLYCNDEIAERENCPKPECTDKRAAARRRMALDAPKRQLPLAITNGQKYGPAMKIESDGLADAYWEMLVEHCMRSSQCSRERAEQIERSNLLYYAGYHSKYTEARVRAMFGPNFPKEQAS